MAEVALRRANSYLTAVAGMELAPFNVMLEGPGFEWPGKPLSPRAIPRPVSVKHPKSPAMKRPGTRSRKMKSPGPAPESVRQVQGVPKKPDPQGLGLYGSG